MENNNVLCTDLSPNISKIAACLLKRSLFILQILTLTVLLTGIAPKVLAAEKATTDNTNKQTDKALATQQAAKPSNGLLPAHLMCVPVGTPQTAKPERRRPGVEIDTYQLPLCDDQGKLKPWLKKIELGPHIPDRWRIVETLGVTENLLDPYNGHNSLKGDLPVWGKDWFYSLIAISDTVVEPRNFPLPVGNPTTSNPDALDTIGKGDSTVFSQSLIVEQVVYQGDTTFRPPDYEFRLTTVFNFNQVHLDERGLLNVDPNLGGEAGRRRSDRFLGLQAAFVDKHLRNVSDRYDFDSLRVGIQPFSSDFRGFLFQDAQLGIRLFGNRDNNIFQYNIAYFKRLEKDTNSGLNDVSQRIRDDEIYTANLYWQDFPVLGFTSQASITYNRNREQGQLEYDQNGFIARPSSLFEERFARNYDVTYLGYSGDGHIDRLNLSTSIYYALGEQNSSRYAQDKDQIKAGFAAAELSIDYDWFRPKLSILWASGDKDPFDDIAEGFDAIFENPQFAGADTSLFIRQNIPLIGGGGVALSGRNGLLPSLRSSKEQGQSNFINPGLKLIGLGFDADLTPELRVSLNANQLWFDQAKVLEALRQQAPINKDLGLDLSVALIWRPYQTQNIVARLSAATLVPGQGFKQLYGSEYDNPYSILANLILTY